MAWGGVLSRDNQAFLTHPPRSRKQWVGGCRLGGYYRAFRAESVLAGPPDPRKHQSTERRDLFGFTDRAISNKANAETENSFMIIMKKSEEFFFSRHLKIFRRITMWLRTLASLPSTGLGSRPVFHEVLWKRNTRTARQPQA